MTTVDSLPADAIRSRDAIALLAGKTLKTNSTAYIRHLRRLARGAKRGQLTEYRLLGPGGVPRHPRYFSRAEVLALRDSLARDGFTAAAPSTYQRRTVQAITKRTRGSHRRQGHRQAGRRHRRGGAKVDGEGPLRRAKDRRAVVLREGTGRRVPAAGRAPAERDDPVRDALRTIRHQVRLTAREAQAIAAAAGHEDLLVFCSECWATPEARSLAHSRREWE